jgi:hypothetical protein
MCHFIMSSQFTDFCPFFKLNYECQIRFSETEKKKRNRRSFFRNELHPSFYRLIEMN